MFLISISSPVFFCPSLKKSLGNLKILDFYQLFIVEAPIKKIRDQNIYFYPLRALLGHPVQRWIIFVL